MKTYKLTTVFSKVALASVLFVAPIATYAADVSTDASLRINNDGIVRVMNAEVTSVSGSVIQAISHFKNTVINWAFTTNSATTVATGNGQTSAVSDIHVGDRINVAGTLTSLGSTISVQANKLSDITSLAAKKTKMGTVQSVNQTNSTFVLKSDDKLITVTTNASTKFKLGNGTSTNILAALSVGSKVAVYGTVSADGSTLTATQVVMKSTGKHEEKEGKDKKFFQNLKTNFGLKFGHR